MFHAMWRGEVTIRHRQLRRGKGGPIEGRPMIKSEFCQIPPNRLQPVDRIAPTWSIGLSTIGQSAVFDRAPDSHDHVHERTAAITPKNGFLKSVQKEISSRPISRASQHGLTRLRRLLLA